MISTNGQLVLHVDKPEAILGLIPTARVREVKGKQLLVLNHDADVVKILRNMGLNPPPIDLTSFKYTGKYKPFDHQRVCTEFLVVNKRGFNLSDPGTGKTAAALWAAEYLRLKGKVRRVLIGCPLSVMSVWEDEAFNVLPHWSFCKLTGTKQRRLDLLGKGSDICVINHDGLTTIHKELTAANFDLIILDEASAYKNAQTRRYRLFRELAKKTAYMWLLTGTPITKAPTDAYGLIKLTNPASFPGGFVLFKEMTMTKVGNFKWIPKIDSKEFVYRHMQPAVRFKKKDCIDLPPVMYVNRTCDMTTEQNKAFSLMKKQMVMEQSTGEKITAANAAVRLLKLMQICCGVVKDNQGEHYILDASTRLNTLQEVIEESGGKAIIFIPFIGVMDAVEKFLKSKGWSTGLVNGSVSEKARSKIFDDFQRGDLELLIAHPRTAAHGLNLTASSTIIWYGPIFSSEQYIQANARIDRAGQKNKMTVYHIISSPIEAAIYRALWGQVQMSNTILEQYEGMMR
jgi:SNF2 family DNA or RNA helicase